ncbi:aldehyde oxidase-like isoform X1 [Toxotes jaculatrix]|nr:aldehyde oxidase-like isoform X1 [Toxotes jaculatrix]
MLSTLQREPVLFLGSSVFFAIKDAVAAARSESGLVGPFTLSSPATPERACLACATPFTQKTEDDHTWMHHGVAVPSVGDEACKSDRKGC